MSQYDQPPPEYASPRRARTRQGRETQEEQYPAGQGRRRRRQIETIGATHVEIQDTGVGPVQVIFVVTVTFVVLAIWRQIALSWLNGRNDETIF